MRRKFFITNTTNMVDENHIPVNDNSTETCGFIALPRFYG
jgi:hypothetical protein